MRIRNYPRTSLIKLVLIVMVILPACSTRVAQAVPIPATLAPTAAAAPDWFSIKLTDVRTGKTFSISDFAGKVVLIETMAEWCPNCARQQNEVKKLEELTNHTKDLVHISLDTDFNEDAASLKDYANSYGFDWYFAISPLEVDRALGNLYSAEFMNPPLTPMLFIDRHGGVYSLPFGPLKGAAALQLTLAPYLAP